MFGRRRLFWVLLLTHFISHIEAFTSKFLLFLDFGVQSPFYPCWRVFSFENTTIVKGKMLWQEPLNRLVSWVKGPILWVTKAHSTTCVDHLDFFHTMNLSGYMLNWVAYTEVYKLVISKIWCHDAEVKGDKETRIF